MCGLFGIVNRDITKVKTIDLIKQSLILNSLRGIDGAGFALVDKKGEVRTYRRPLPGWDLVQLAPTKSLLDSGDNIVFGLVHNRAGTTGGIQVETSHPINYKHITLIHNGSVHSLHDLGSTALTHDSTAIAIALADKDERETLELILGSYALIWYNAIDTTLNIARNDQRPLFAATIKKSKSILYGSEDGMLLWLASRNSIDIKDIVNVPTGVHIKIPLDEAGRIKTSKFTIKTYTYAAPVQNLSDWGYKITAVTEKFTATYQGVLDSFGKTGKQFKFKRDGDPMYAWLTPYNPEIEPLLIHGRTYNLVAMDSRSSASVSANLNAELLSASPIEIVALPKSTTLKDFYKEGSEVTFEVDHIYPSPPRGNTSGSSFEGVATDGSEADVRSYNVTIPLKKGVRYTGAVRAVIKSKKDHYVLVNGDTVREASSKEVIELCGWCDEPLTQEEISKNSTYSLGNDALLCGKCSAQYNFNA